ncbi:hypothetical protein [Pseudomonas sp. SWI44]|uniref:hypothetical protein n=1 Tax=Pseudomonas sp. SWI44 TaxID=2083053 RepID=UPI001319D8A8|nr:hypothetical protein [Pseudomonas sp. SWI44]
MQGSDEISIVDIYKFISSQARVIVATFILITIAGLAYTITRPTLYQSTSIVTIGKSLSLYTNTLTPLESPEQTSYKYSGTSTVSPVKNTNIVEVASISTDREKSIENVQNTIKKIAEDQGRLYQDQEQKFIKYIELLNISDASTAEVLGVLQTASETSSTYSSEIVTTVLPYSGKFTSNLIITILASISLALSTGAIKELFKRAHEKK